MRRYEEGRTEEDDLMKTQVTYWGEAQERETREKKKRMGMGEKMGEMTDYA